MGYIDTQLFIDGKWQAPAEGKTLPVVNPATGKEIGRVAHAGRPDLDRALEAAQKGFAVWRGARTRGAFLGEPLDHVGGRRHSGRAPRNALPPRTVLN
jgi:acyl-CoA reductase-like NAD-dependent aldehyde dehydrogenase